LKRFLDRLDPADHDRFSRQCAAGMAAAYPANARGETIFPFTRLFVLARRRQ
jgi:trans-aconitate methyltransferase